MIALKNLPGVLDKVTVVRSLAAWDAVHYRRRLVVSRSLAEACLSLDLLLGLGLIALAAITAVLASRTLPRGRIEGHRVVERRQPGVPRPRAGRRRRGLPVEVAADA